MEMMKKRARRGAGCRRGRSRGQSTIEFAIVLPLFLFLFLGMIEMGWAWFAASQVEQAAFEGAYFISRQVPITAFMLPQANAVAQSFASRFTGAGGTLFAAVTQQPFGQTPLGGESRNLVKVEVRLQYPLITGSFLRSFPFGAFTVFGDGMVISRASYALTEAGSS